MSEQLSLELLDLMEYEKVIEQGLGTFVEVGMALLAIRDGRKYVHAGYRTFEEYCERRWSIAGAAGYELTERCSGRRLKCLQLQTRAPQSKGRCDRSHGCVNRTIVGRRGVSPLKWQRPDQPTGKQVEQAVRSIVGPRTVPKPTAGVASHRTRRRIRSPCSSRSVTSSATTRPCSTRSVGSARSISFGPTARRTGVELEPEWAEAHPDTVIGDSPQARRDVRRERLRCHRHLARLRQRLAQTWYDAFDAKARRTYTIDLGRPLSDGNGAGARYGTNGDYERLHVEVWQQCRHILRPAGLLLLNCKDFHAGSSGDARHRMARRTTGRIGFRAIDLRTLSVAGLPMASAFRCPSWSSPSARSNHDHRR